MASARYCCCCCISETHSTISDDNKSVSRFGGAPSLSVCVCRSHVSGTTKHIGEENDQSVPDKVVQTGARNCIACAM